MAINATDFTIDASGNIRQATAFVPGTHSRYSTLELHAWLQDLADNSAPAGDDLVSILGNNPSELAGKRNASRPMALTLLPNFNINDATAQWFKFGSIEQNSGNDLYTGLKVLGSLVASSPIYIIQNAAKITKYWQDADAANFQILVKAKSGGALIDSGNITVFSRKYGQTYSHFDVNLAAGGEQAAALSTSIDGNVDTGTMTPAVCASYFATAIGGTGGGTPKITLAYGDTTQDLGGGQGALLHKGTITLDGSITLAQAYQALMWACSESSTINFNAIPGWRYRVLPGQAYAENIAAPFGTFAGGKWFVAQGWWLTGVQAADSKNYQLVSHTGVTETPPTSIAVQIGGVVAGDYVLVGRDNGSGGILDTEYTVSGSSGATSITVTGLKADTPASGVIRIDGDRYIYTGWSGTTVSGLAPALSKTYTNRPAFIPLIDAVASGPTINSAQMQFGSNFTCRYRVRNGGGSPIVPFESTLAVTSNGGSGTAVRNADQ
ncbi:hypothetical protein [Dechloromonas sp. CZR5]|uniref:hypothetical protein n=1 Tax=Dechloromonas sp. CZR5 TaxID=2608630 RepID=UPI00123E4156|nr:hypothetical protein [Dechloromonas sp. CZR5]